MPRGRRRNCRGPSASKPVVATAGKLLVQVAVHRSAHTTDAFEKEGRKQHRGRSREPDVAGAEKKREEWIRRDTQEISCDTQTRGMARRETRRRRRRGLTAVLIRPQIRADYGFLPDKPRLSSV